MESIGTRLKKVRLEKGLTLEEVHKKTKIHSDILKAIEEDSLINLDPVYIKGFLKIYCKFLGLGPGDFIVGYKDPQSTVKYVPDTQQKSTPFLKTAAIKLFSLKAIPVKIKTIFILILVFIFLSISLFNLGKIIFSKRSSPKADRLSTSAREKKEVEITNSNKTQVVTVVPKSTSEVNNTLKLGIRARGDCWIQLKIDGRVVFQSILRKGRTETWQAKDKIELSLGNAGGVDLEVNSKLISSLGRKGQVIRNILITKEGITVGR